MEWTLKRWINFKSWSNITNGFFPISTCKLFFNRILQLVQVCYIYKQISTSIYILHAVRIQFLKTSRIFNSNFGKYTTHRKRKLQVVFLDHEAWKSGMTIQNWIQKILTISAGVDIYFNWLLVNTNMLFAEYTGHPY